MHGKSAGTYRPNFKRSSTIIKNSGRDVTIGSDLAVGSDGNSPSSASLTESLGEAVVKVDRWPYRSYNSDGSAGYQENEETFSANIDEANFFRFNNDLGGWVIYGAGDYSDPSEALKKQSARVLPPPNKTLNIPGFQEYNASTTHINTRLSKNTDFRNPEKELNRIGRSSFIGYNTFGEMEESISYDQNSIHYKAYDKANVPGQFYTVNDEIRDQVASYRTVNENGLIYNYGLPVFAKNEKNISIDIDPTSNLVEKKYIAYKDADVNDAGVFENAKTLQGTAANGAYTTAHLLTDITTSDYIDRTNDGCTPDDFGGYTTFKYKRMHGHNNKSDAGEWYTWRMPYQGLRYTKNSLSNPKDDMGSFSSGEKEVYYLESIETKTHIAVFHTSPRMDGVSADNDPTEASTSGSAQGDKYLEKLDRIELFAREDYKQNQGSATPIKVVHFQYDYSLCGNVKNNKGDNIDVLGNSPAEIGNKNINENKGKLTLKRVWFDFGGTYRAKISPYQFDYKYPALTDYEAEVRAKYPTILNDVSQLTPTDQNPDYDVFGLDSWGNYQIDGATRHDNLQTWSEQKEQTHFDPAAWQLKQIKLPSGGEIHVQYEQDEYAYVQDQEAHVMAPLVDIDLDRDRTFDIDMGKIGITDPQEIQQVVNRIRARYVYGGHKIYFKFLYNLLGGTKPYPDECSSEYITGYAKVKSAQKLLNQNKIQIRLGGETDENTWPRRICKDFMNAERAGIISTKMDCFNQVVDDIDNVNQDDFEKSARKAIESGLKFLEDSPNLVRCSEINEELSYFRIPMPITKGKKGGGIRVKRLLMYDKGIEAGTAMLYGSEYDYRMKDETSGKVICSGVATNEPQGMREENILVDYIKREKQSELNRIIAGRDKKQSEGPIGESALPAPSVGYAHVMVKNIHTGKTNTGITTYDYLTARDYPMVVDMTPIDRKTDFLPLPGIPYSQFTNSVFTAQGFIIKKYNRHGLMEKVSTYSTTTNALNGLSVDGSIDDSDALFDPTNRTLVSSNETIYFEPEEEIPVMYGIKDYRRKPLGVEMDLIFESRAITDRVNTGELEWDVDLGFFGPSAVPYASAVPSFTTYLAEMKSHVTNKVISYPAVAKGQKNYADGVWSFAENLAFSPVTGKPLVSRSYDSYHDIAMGAENLNGAYTSYSIPAWTEYSAFEPKFMNEGLVLSSNWEVDIDKVVDGDKVYLEFRSLSNENLCDFMDQFSGGDLVKLFPKDSENTLKGIYHLGEAKANRIELLPTYYYEPHTESGYTNDLSVEILRSGRNNQLNTIIGSFTTHGKGDANCIECPDMTVTDIEHLSPPTNLGDRKDFVDELNTALTTVLVGNPVDISVIPDLLQNPLSKPNCLQEPVTVRVEKDSNGNITIKVLTANERVYPYGNTYDDGEDQGEESEGYNHHPLVDDLNRFLNEVWAKSQGKNAGGPLIAGKESYGYRFAPLIDNGSWSGLPFAIKYQNLMVNGTYEAVNGGTKQASEIFNINGLPSEVYAFSKQFDYGHEVYVSDIPIPFAGGTVVQPQIVPGQLLPSNLIFSDFWDRVIPGAGSGCISLPSTGYSKGLEFGNNFDEFDNQEEGDDETDFTDNVGRFYQLNNKLWYKCYICGDPQSSPQGPEIPSPPSNMDGEKELCEKTCIDEVQFYVEQATWMCEDFIENGNLGIGTFRVNSENGLLEYVLPGACEGEYLDCVQFCVPLTAQKEIRRVVNASSQTLQDHWPYNEAPFAIENNTDVNNLYETGEKGRWKTESSYTYREDINGIHQPYDPIAATEYNYNTGLFPLVPFNWDFEEINDPEKWIKVSTVTRYSPQGVPTEEKNIQNIYRTAQFGYGNIVPVLVAQNAQEGEVYFESFEMIKDASTGTLENGAKTEANSVISIEEKHSGKRSLSIGSGKMIYQTPTFTPGKASKKGGMNVRLWMKGYKDGGELYTVVTDGQGNSHHRLPQLIAKVGEWALVEMKFSQSAFSIPSSDYRVTIRTNYLKGYIHIDDIRIKPQESAITTYVYDDLNFRLLTRFDDQLFGSFNQYNEEGVLLRKRIETTRGMKTVSESHINVPRNEVIKVGE